MSVGPILLLSALAMAKTAASATIEELYVASPLTEPGAFTGGIEGPTVDAEGDIFAVNFAEQGTIGRVSPEGKGEVFVRLPGESVGNGIVIDSDGMMFVADYVGHNVLKVDPKTREVEVFAHEPGMNQPNDLAIAPDDTIFASDPKWADGTGQVWRVSASGEVSLASPGMGTTNGIEVGPDGDRLYVNESVQRNIWMFPIEADGTLGEKELFARFPDFGFDGMRCDVEGNLYVTRHGKGTVVVLSPEGEVLREVDVLGKFPTNLCFGGPDGRTVYVTEVEHARLVSFRVEAPGLAWQRRRAR
jgi:sugar lactone lactonase YvrE